MRLFSIAPGQPFLDTLARWWLADSGPDPVSVADGMILLPTRRAARSLTEAFLRAGEGRPLLLPRIVAFGALDETPLVLAGALELAPAVPEMERLAVLARFVLQLRGAGGAPGLADSAWRLARELADLLDEAYRQEVRLEEALPAAAEAGYAAHWQETIRFLEIVNQHWPAYLAETGHMDGAQRALRLLQTQALVWEAEPPASRIVVAGTTGGIPAVAKLMRVVARLPLGAVVFPGLDLAMDEALWGALDDGHPQAGLARLLRSMGATRADVQPLGGAEVARAATIARSMLPAGALAAWRAPFTPAVSGLHLLEPADQQEEAVAIALALREALERPDAQAALVTPDRALALRVAAELARFGVIVDDSAGERLADTPPAAFLRLLARAVAEDLAPVALLAVLKHPLAAFGLAPGACRGAARRLERLLLRGPPPPPGIAGLRARLAERPRDTEAAATAAELIDRLEHRLAPLLALRALDAAAPADALAALLAAAEAAAQTDRQDGAARLWALEEGEALSALLTPLGEALALLPPQPLAVLPGLLDAALEGAVVRSRRALRGREGAEHPRVAILGLLEARLQSFDMLVLGGLAETVWPTATDPGPWMSRPMRRAVGLASPEERIGQMAHDFAMLACAAPKVLLSCPQRRDGAPAVPARWLVRLRAFLRGHDAGLPIHPAASWAQQLDLPPGEPIPVAPPAPRPPVALRPRRLTVTEIETWLRDPYAIHARHILRVRALDPLEQNADAADYGTLVHSAVKAFIEALPDIGMPGNAAARLRAEMDRALAGRALRPAIAAWWRPRLHRIADWLAALEAERRRVRPPVDARCEVPGEWRLEAIDFVLAGVADRIERHRDGTLCVLDYKTGTTPTQADVDRGTSNQLLLEAAMAEAEAFGAALAAPSGELAYWRLTGGHPAGEVQQLFRNDPSSLQDRVRAAAASLVDLVRTFDDPATPYLSQPHPGQVPRFSDYAQLARVGEWAVLEEGEA